MSFFIYAFFCCFLFAQKHNTQNNIHSKKKKLNQPKIGLTQKKLFTLSEKGWELKDGEWDIFVWNKLWDKKIE